MNKNKLKNNNQIILIVVGSLIAFTFFVLAIFMIMFSSGRYSEVASNFYNQELLDERYFLNTDYQDKDPYMTKVPALRDMIRGPIITDLDPSIGKKDSRVTIAFFSDFECSYCARQEKVLKEVLDKYEIRLIWKDYPATDERSRSYQAALAARCAQREGAFWEYHNKLFSGNYGLDKTGFMNIAEELNLDTVDFEKCLTGALTAGLVNDNILEADALGIDGVPFLYINDKEILGEIDREELETMVRMELEKGN